MAQVDSKPVAIIDDPTKKSIETAYKALLSADKDFQIILLKARIKYKVDESWSLDLGTMTFHPPEKKEEKKEVKP